MLTFNFYRKLLVMKKLFILLILTSFFAACEKNNLTEENQSSSGNFLKSSNDLTICHHSGDSWNIININPSAWPAHEAHGDAVDMDGDGYFNKACGCSDVIDCDDEDPTVNPGAEEICDNGIDDNCNGEIDEGCGSSSDGPSVLYVNMGSYTLEVLPTDETANWDAAVANCEGTFYDNNDWYLPSKDELNAVYEQLGPVDNGGSGDIITGEYWSSSSGLISLEKWFQNFENGSQSTAEIFQTKKYRCVRKQ